MSTATILAPARTTARTTAPTAATTVATTRHTTRTARTPLARLSLQQRRRRLTPARHAWPAIQTPPWCERFTLWVLLLPYSGIFVWSAVRDTQAIRRAPASQRPALRLRMAWERVRLSHTLRRIQRQTQRAYQRTFGQAFACVPDAAGAPALWDLQMAVLLDTYLATHGKRLMRTVDHYGALCYSLEASADISADSSADVEKERNPAC